MQHQTPSTYRTRSDTWLGRPGCQSTCGSLPHPGAMGHRTCKTCFAELLQIAQPPKMHAFMSGVLELKSNLGHHLHLQMSKELAGHLPVFFARIGDSPTNHRISDIAMSRENRSSREVFSVALPTFPLQLIHKTISPPLEHENNTSHSGHSKPRCSPLNRAERMPTPKPSL